MPIIEDDSRERWIIQSAAQLVFFAPQPKHTPKRELLEPLRAQRRIWRDSPNHAARERAWEKMGRLYAEWSGGQDALWPNVAPQHNLSPDRLDGFLDRMSHDELGGRPTHGDNYTVRLLTAYYRLFGERPETMQHFERRRASIARKRGGKDGQPKDRGGAVFFVAQFEAEVEAVMNIFPGQPHQFRRTLESIRNHIGRIG
ncbi:MAG TPA: hypothetical protein VG735_12340 [Caulobacterales bacterium]|nr:hypothetical protein [Caulobacterales bacterium]